MTYTERRSALLAVLHRRLKGPPIPEVWQNPLRSWSHGFPLKEQRAAQRASMQRITSGRLE
jgi:hypothetical protein